jgi:hypothetical protein
MSLEDGTKAIVASNLTTALHVESARRRARVENALGTDIPKDWELGHPEASEEVFNTYLGFLVRLTEYDGSDHMKPE